MPRRPPEPNPARTPRTPKNARAKPAAAPVKRPPRRRQPKDWAPKFLEELKTTGMVSVACERAAVGRTTVYDRRDVDEEFRAAWDEVIERTTELMEREAYRRSVVGTDRPVFQGGEQVGVVREYSDTLLMFLLKARRPETYRERLEHSGPGGGPLEHRMRLDLRGLTDEQLAALEQIQPADRTVQG